MPETSTSTLDLTIAEMAERTGLSAHTLRYYERIGLLDPVRRGIGGQRRYGEEDLQWVTFLQRLRATGMPIRDMQRYADLRRRGDSTITERRELLEDHRDELITRIEELQRELQALTDKIGHYAQLENEHAGR
jgi:DNA-binding transcriptional MerR regulator